MPATTETQVYLIKNLGSLLHPQRNKQTLTKLCRHGIGAMDCGSRIRTSALTAVHALGVAKVHFLLQGEEMAQNECRTF